MGFFNTDDSQRGYRDGENDAANGKDRDYSRAGMSAGFWFRGPEASERALDSYCDSYNKGYDNEMFRETFDRDDNDRDW